MDKIIINGGKRLKGEVSVSGSKNAALPILAAAMLGDSPSVIHNVPGLVDISTMCDILRKLGVKVEIDDGSVTVDPRKIKKHIAPYELVRKMRASICVLGPLLGRLGRAEVSMPGGCVIGPRPIDLHLKGIKALGAKLEIRHGYVKAETKRLKGNEVFLGGRFGSSVLATVNVMLAAVKASGKTVIENAACEPEVVDTADFLVKMGARIEGIGSHVLNIIGVKELEGAEHSVIPDRIETATYMMAAAATKGDVIIKEARPDHLHAVIDKMRDAGINVKCGEGTIKVTAARRLKPVDIITMPYPGYPTDLQAQIMALMTITPGISLITEKIYPERFMHIPELLRMAADIKLEGETAVVNGVKRLSGAPVMASDLRASAGLIIAGLAAEGITEISRVYHLDRGYEGIKGKLASLPS